MSAAGPSRRVTAAQNGCICTSELHHHDICVRNNISRAPTGPKQGAPVQHGCRLACRARHKAGACYKNGTEQVLMAVSPLLPPRAVTSGTSSSSGAVRPQPLYWRARLIYACSNSLLFSCSYIPTACPFSRAGCQTVCWAGGPAAEGPQDPHLRSLRLPHLGLRPLRALPACLLPHLRRYNGTVCHVSVFRASVPQGGAAVCALLSLRCGALISRSLGGLHRLACCHNA